MSEESPAKVQLKREVGFLSGSGLIIGTMIGSGIFISPGGVLKRSGSVAMSIIVWFLCGVTACFASLSYIELGTLIPESGGEHVYLHRAFGPVFAYLFSWINTICARPASFAILCQAFASYAVEPFYANDDAADDDEIWMIKTAVTIAAMIVISAINCWSVKVATIIQNALTFAKLIALALITIGGTYKLFRGNTEHLAEGFNHVENTESSIGSIALAFYSGLWAYDGWNQLNFITEEIKNPLRNLPLAILLGVPFVTFLYLSANVSYLTLLSPREMHESKAVAITWAGRFFTDDNPDLAYVDRYLPWVMTAFVVMSTFGAANGSLFSSARLTFAAARAGHLPEVLSYVHTSCFTPLISLIVITVISIIMVLLTDINTLIDFFSFSSWIFYGGCFLAVIVMRFTKKSIPRPFKVWILVPITVFLLSIYLVIAPIIQDPAIEYLFVLAFIVVGLIFYVPFVHYKKRTPGMDMFNKFCQKAFCSSLSE